MQTDRCIFWLRRDGLREATTFPLPLIRPDAEGGDPPAKVVLAACLFTMVDDVAPERCVRLAVERSDESTDDRAEHLCPGGRLLTEVVETPEAAVDLLPV